MPSILVHKWVWCTEGWLTLEEISHNGLTVLEQLLYAVVQKQSNNATRLKM
jgi:hypothetical protein